VEHSIIGIIDRVDALETGLPPMDQDKLRDDTREDEHDEEEEVEDEEMTVDNKFSSHLVPEQHLVEQVV
jgi:hypothetical protein